MSWICPRCKKENSEETIWCKSCQKGKKPKSAAISEGVQPTTERQVRQPSALPPKPKAAEPIEPPQVMESSAPSKPKSDRRVVAGQAAPNMSKDTPLKKSCPHQAEQALQQENSEVRTNKYLEHIYTTRSTEIAAKDALGKWNENAFTDTDLEKMVAGVMGVQMMDRQKVTEGVIEVLYSGIFWNGPVTIGVFTDEAQGKGDLSLGIKMVQILRKAFPQSKGDDITLLMPKKAKTQGGEMFAKAGIDPVVLPGKDTQPKLPKPEQDHQQGPEFALMGPHLGSRSNTLMRDIHSNGWTLESNILGVTEYSKKEDGATPSGLGAEELGITFDQGLLAHKRNQDSIESEKDKRIERLKILSQIGDKELLKVIINKAVYSEESLLTYQNNPNSRLYFAYSNKSADRFAWTVTTLEKDNGETPIEILNVSPTFFGNADSYMNFEKLKADLTEAKEKLKTYGVKTVNLITTGMTRGDHPINVNGSETIETGRQEGKTMRWIITPGLPHDYMLKFFKASEEITMTTGNQSTSEALSAGKTILYENIGKAQSNEFSRQLYGKKTSQHKDINALSADYDSETKGGKKPKFEQYEKAAAALQKLKEDKYFSVLSDTASKTKDLGKRLAGKYKRSLLLKDPAAKAILEDVEDKIAKRNPKVEQLKSLIDALKRLK